VYIYTGLDIQLDRFPLKVNEMLQENLTHRQKEVYEFIREKIQNRGYGPTVREIGENFGIRSPNGVMCHLKALEKKGLITRSPNKSRAIELTMEPNVPDRSLPLVGQVSAGVLHEAIAQEKRVDFSEIFIRPDCYVLEVSGDSMIDAHIDDGDYVVVDPHKQAYGGEIVVAQTDEGNATVKYWHPEKDSIRLQPANQTMQPIYVKDAQVKGVVVGVVRTL